MEHEKSQRCFPSFLALCVKSLTVLKGVGACVSYLRFSNLSLWLTKFQSPRDWPVKEDSIDLAFFRAESVPGWKQGTEMHVSFSLEKFSSDLLSAFKTGKMDLKSQALITFSHT